MASTSSFAMYSIPTVQLLLPWAGGEVPKGYCLLGCWVQHLDGSKYWILLRKLFETQHTAPRPTGSMSFPALGRLSIAVHGCRPTVAMILFFGLLRHSDSGLV